MKRIKLDKLQNYQDKSIEFYLGCEETKRMRDKGLMT